MHKTIIINYATIRSFCGIKGIPPGTPCPCILALLLRGLAHGLHGSRKVQMYDIIETNKS